MRQFALVLLLLGVQLLAQPQALAQPVLLARTPEVASYRAQHYTREQGLMTESLLHVTRLQDGRQLIVGVRGEPMLFDGHRFSTLPYSREDAAHIDGGFATVQSDDGDLWLSSQRTGLHQMRGTQLWHHGLPFDAKPSLIVLTRDRKSLLLPTNQGLFRAEIASAPIKFVALSQRLSFIAAIETPDGTLYAGGGTGLYRIRDGVAVSAHPKLQNVHIWSLAIDHRGRLLVCTRGLGLVILDGDKLSQISIEQGLPNSVVRSVAEVGDALWLATAGGGIARVVAGQVEVFSTAQGLSSDTVTWISADLNGVLWATTAGAGLNRLWPSALTNYSDTSGRRGGFHYALHRDPKGQIWIGSNQGLARLDGQLRVPIGVPGDGQASTILSMIDDPDGGLLIATRRGLFRYQQGVGFSAVPSAEQFDAPVLWKTPAGPLVGSADRLWRVERTGLQAIAQLPAPGAILSFANDPEYELLVATSIGAFSLKQGTLQLISPAGRASTSFWRDGTQLYVGGESLGRLNASGWSEVRVKSEAGKNATIYNFWADTLGGLWLTTREGLLRVEHSALSDVAPQQILPATYIGLADGLAATEFEGGPQSMLSNPDGSLLLVNTGGICRLDPRQIGDAFPAISITLDSIEDEQSSRTPTSNLMLPAGTQRVGLSFSALPASHSASVRLSYRLLPIESEFRSDQGQRAAVYGGLRPGRYVLELKGEIPGLVPVRSVYQYSFDIAPRPIERLSVQLALGATLLSLLALLPTLHIRSLRSQRKRLIAEVANRTAALEELARTDGLTGLLNRRSFDQALSEVLARKVVVGMIMIDVDHFKRYNDSLGHQAGDHCLRSIAKALAQTVASFPEAFPRLVARIGGEEFAVLLGVSNAERLNERAEALRVAVKALALAHPGAPSGTVSLSLGLTLSDPSDSVDSFIQRADQALYQAKHLGRDRWVMG